MPGTAAKVRLLTDGGLGSMGDRSDDSNLVARWYIEEGRHVVAGLRVHFLNGSGSADVKLAVDHREGEAYDYTLHTFKSRGVNADVDFRVPEDERDHYTVEAGDYVVLEWADPSTGVTNWGAELRLLNAEDA